MKYIKNTLLALSLSLLILGVAGFAGSSASALNLSPSPIIADSRDDACQGLNQVSGTGCNGGQAGISKVAVGVVTIISYIAGLVAIIMVIVSGIKYAASGGDSARVSGAKTTIVYALIGVAIAALAQVLVHFVLNQASGV